MTYDSDECLGCMLEIFSVEVVVTSEKDTCTLQDMFSTSESTKEIYVEQK